MLLIITLAALVAAIGWFIRDIPGIVAAGRTGQIRSKSFGSPLIRRSDDPERFDRLVSYRKRQLIWPFLMLIVALAGFLVILLPSILVVAGG